MFQKLKVSKEGPKLENLEWRDIPRGKYNISWGPLENSWALEAKEGGEELKLRTKQPVGKCGSLAVCFRSDRVYHTGRITDRFKQQILKVEDLIELNFVSERNETSIQWIWKDKVEKVDPIVVLTPGYPGPQWYYVAFHWDSEKGLFNGYINGTPLRLPNTKVEPWSMGQSNSITIPLSNFAFTELVISDEPFKPENLEEWVPKLYWGSVDSILGSGERGSISIADKEARLIYEASLSKASDVSNWVMEGPGDIRFTDGWMEMRSNRPQGPEGHIVFWCEKNFPENFILKWEIQLLTSYGLCIVFFCARGSKGEDLFDPHLCKRSGIFSQYHSGDIDCYHISYYANTPFNPGRITSNMRKNSGFYLVDNGPAGIQPGSQNVHQVILIKEKGHIQLGVDDSRIINFYDDGERYGSILGSGKIGLRQMQWMEAKYRNFKVYEIK